MLRRLKIQIMFDFKIQNLTIWLGYGPPPPLLLSTRKRGRNSAGQCSCRCVHTYRFFDFPHQNHSHQYSISHLLVIHWSVEISPPLLSLLSFATVVGWRNLLYTAMAVWYEGSIYIILNFSWLTLFIADCGEWVIWKPFDCEFHPKLFHNYG
jgi:hypothetical protein